MNDPTDRPIDPVSMREQLAAARGEQFWRRVAELGEAAGFEKFLRRELARPDTSGADALGRRRFLALMGASLALAGLGGCGLKPPEEKIFPYVDAPGEIVPGKPLFFATAMTLGGLATGLLVESHEGRPTKIEGNEYHPASLGATDRFAQAAVFGLYDPDRSQSVTYLGEIRSWEGAASAIRAAMQQQRRGGGAGFRLLTETVTSPTLAHQIQALLRDLPKAKWHQYEPAGRDMVRAGARLAFGRYVDTRYDFSKANVILSIDADFLVSGPGQVRYARDFMTRRRGEPGLGQAESIEMNRLYMVQCSATCTGAKADHCWPLRPSQIEPFARALAAKLEGRLKPLAEAVPSPIPEEHLESLAADLLRDPASSLVIAGEEQSPTVHLLAHAMNHALGNEGTTVIHIDPVEANPVDQAASLGELADDVARGEVGVLVILGGNPAYTAPADLQFAGRLQKVPLRIHLGLYHDETAALCHWHIPEAHFLESWGDARAYDGTASIVQPLIAPLYGGKSAHELLQVLSDQPERTTHEIVQDYWRDDWKKRHDQHGDGQGDFEHAWRFWLHQGLVARSEFPPKSISLQENWADSSRHTPYAVADGTRSMPATIEIIFRPDPTVYDGRFANNGWLQELPKQPSKLLWENAALMSRATAEQYGLHTEPSGHGGDRGEARADAIELRYQGRTLRAPVWIAPGQPDGCVTLWLGYGRTRAGHVGSGLGYNAYALRTWGAPWSNSGLEIRPTGEQAIPACTQFQQTMQNRHPVQAGTLGDYRADPTFARSKEEREEEKMGDRRASTLYLPQEYPYNGYKWAMVIDLTACTGCNACVMACQAENNCPVIGKEQVNRGRAMHWLRIDRYCEDGPEGLRTYFQPVPCMQCENAPCELVCPVGATVHSEEGLNDMVYNRCVGTRYCSNNCPYKVRRFNFFQYTDFTASTLNLGRNPAVTVRSRGVMEKCTYCVQRIIEARIAAEKQDRDVRDGEVLTACQAACPSGAIVFGNLNDTASRVARWRADPRRYSLLALLNTQPRTTYLAALRNPNPDIKNKRR